MIFMTLNENQQKIIAAMREIEKRDGNSSLSAGAIAEYVGQSSVSTESILEELNRMGHIGRHQFGSPMVLYTLKK